MVGMDPHVRRAGERSVIHLDSAERNSNENEKLAGCDPPKYD